MAALDDSLEVVSTSYLAECGRESGAACRGEDGDPCCPFGDADGCGDGGDCGTGGYYEAEPPCEEDIVAEISCCSNPQFPDVKGTQNWYCKNGICTAPDDRAKSCKSDEIELFTTSLGNTFVAHLGECGEHTREEEGSDRRPTDWRCGPPMDPSSTCPAIGGVYISDDDDLNFFMPPTQLSFPHFASWTSDPSGGPTVMMFKDEKLDIGSDLDGGKTFLYPKVRTWRSTRAQIMETLGYDAEEGEVAGEEGEDSEGENENENENEGLQYDGDSDSDGGGDADDNVDTSTPTTRLEEFERKTAVLINPPTRAMPVPGQIVCGLTKWSQEWRDLIAFEERQAAEAQEGNGDEDEEKDERVECAAGVYDEALEHQDKAGSIFEAWGGYSVEISNFYGRQNNNVLIRPPIDGKKVKPKKHG